MNGSQDEKIRVLVVSESPLARAGLEVAVSQSERFEVVGAASLAATAALLESLAPDAILMDTSAFSAWQPRESVSAHTPSAPVTPLTPREIEVLHLLADGASNKVIAFRLGISDHTVKFHVASILSKLNAGSRTEAVTAGVRLGVIYL